MAKRADSTYAPGQRTSLALAWRLQRGMLLAWAVAPTAFGAGLGGAAQSAAEQLNAMLRVGRRSVPNRAD